MGQSIGPRPLLTSKLPKAATHSPTTHTFITNPHTPAAIGHLLHPLTVFSKSQSVPQNPQRATRNSQLATKNRNPPQVAAVNRCSLIKMDIENHTKVYLPNSVVVDASKEAGKAYRDDITIRMSGNKYFADLLRQGGVQKDQRILRVARLLDQLNGQEKALIKLTDEVFDICAKEQLRYVGFHPRLERLIKDVRHNADFVDEFAKRVGLWLDYHRTHGIGLGDTARSSLQRSVSEQRKLTTGLVWSAVMASPTGKIRPPGPGKLPYGVRDSFPHTSVAISPKLT